MRTKEQGHRRELGQVADRDGAVHGALLPRPYTPPASSRSAFEPGDGERSSGAWNAGINPDVYKTIRANQQALLNPASVLVDALPG